MTKLHPYAARVYEDLVARIPWEKEFLQAVEELLASISFMLPGNPQFESERILERLVEPERIISFRLVWTDDQNEIHVNRAWRVQFNSALGPYKGGTRFHASVTLSSLKFLGFEQIFKNALTGLPMGGGKGGADFNFRGRSEHEMMRFCQSYMTELAHHIGPDTDVPAGDIGVGTREIGYLFGQYKRMTRTFNGTLTGKGLDWGGSRLRPEATGFGITYFAQEMLKTIDENFDGKTVAISGFGNVAWGVAKKVTELGGKVVTISGPDGFIHDPAGLNEEKIEFMKTMRMGSRDEVKEFAEQFKGVTFHEAKRPWIVPCDIAIPCAIQNELDHKDALSLVKNKCKVVVEGANMPTTREAIAIFKENKMMFAPGKASNAGGVAVSGLEMSQNRTGTNWPIEKVDANLHQIMRNIHTICINASEQYAHPNDYVIGANIGGFSRVAWAMLDQGAV